MPDPRIFGHLRPLGGGDPIPMLKNHLTLGRRPSCDVVIDFDNISGRHCELKFAHGVWQVRDLGSTNGTFVNGQKVSHDQSVMPDDELVIATHGYWIDYDPVSHGALQEVNQVLEEEMGAGRKKSLLELAGLEGGSPDRKARAARPTRAPDTIERPSAADAEFDSPIPATFAADAPIEPPTATDEEFLNLIQGEIEGEGQGGKKA
jgi:pSer/pThr/pTyr-binding forkhead associated (FHA) protein